MKIRPNWRLVFLLLLLGGLAIREVAYRAASFVSALRICICSLTSATRQTARVTAIDLVRLAPSPPFPWAPGLPGCARIPPARKSGGSAAKAATHGYSTCAPTRIAAHIAVGNSPYALDFSPDGARAYVAASGSNAWSASMQPRAKSIGRSHAGRKPWIARVSPDGKMLVVSNHDDATVSLFDPATLQLLA